MFKKKGCIEQKHITFDVNVIGATALHIKKGGTYILEVPSYLPSEELNKVLKMLKETTGSKWIILQGGTTVRKAEYV
jgi:thioredoxin-related protein